MKADKPCELQFSGSQSPGLVKHGHRDLDADHIVVLIRAMN